MPMVCVGVTEYGRDDVSLSQRPGAVGSPPGPGQERQLRRLHYLPQEVERKYELCAIEVKRHI